MTAQMMVKIDPTLKSRLTRLARLEGKTTSQLVRELIASYVDERDIAPYVDDLWKRIGSKLAAKGRRRGDIGKVVRQVRKEKNVDAGRH